jgi:glycosyltransferase involved in cell wall biosynthesis
MPVDRVGELLREMDVMLALSTRETFSQAIVQGMLAGLPVIASPLPVYEEKLDTGAGVVARTTAEVADAMASLARDPQRRRAMGAAGRETALQRYVWDTDVFIRRHLFPENAPAD